MKELTFHRPTIIDPARAGGEPSVEGLPDGTLLYGAHASTTLFRRDLMPDPDYVRPYTGATYVWRSGDGGTSWQYVGLLGTGVGPHATVSGFSDPDFAVDSAGNVYTAGINLANVYVAKSSDSGRTWTGHPFGVVATDREWLAADEANVVYMNGNSLALGRELWKSTDGGLTFNQISTGLIGSGPPSKIDVDKSDGRLYFPAADGRMQIFPNARAGNMSSITVNMTGGTPHAHGFLVDMAIDRSGNVYVVYNTANQVRVSYSTDRGLTWTPVVVHDAGPSNTVLWPWISAGDDGRVGVSWLQADRAVPNTQTTPAEYRIHAAQTTTGHGWVDDCGVAQPPAWQVTVATPQPIHVGTICSTGTTCQITNIDRRLGDYHTNAVTADGRFVIAYSNTTFKPTSAISRPGFVSQCSGIDFYPSSRGPGKKGPPGGVPGHCKRAAAAAAVTAGEAPAAPVAGIL